MASTTAPIKLRPGFERRHDSVADLFAAMPAWHRCGEHDPENGYRFPEKIMLEKMAKS